MTNFKKIVSPSPITSSKVMGLGSNLTQSYLQNDIIVISYLPEGGENLTCYHPLVRRIHLGEYLTAKDGHKYPKADIISTEEYEQYDKLNDLNIGKMQKTGFSYRFQKIPCGKCIGCKLDYSRQWATRCMYESKEFQQNWFVTITYDEEHKPILNEMVNEETGQIYKRNENWNGTLNPLDLTKFIKDIRRHWKYHFNHDNIRFYACGEYGSETERPHYHILFFNLPLKEYMLKPLFVNDLHQQIYSSEYLQNIWKKGIVSIGNVTWSSCAYVARYITKKISGDMKTEHYLSKGQIPEFVRMSNRPGIGRKYYEEHKKEIYQTDEVIQTTCTNNQLSIKPPKYYDRLYDIDYPEDMKRIKSNRQASSKKALKTKMSKTTLTQAEQMNSEERSKLLKTKKLIRSLK